MSLSQRGIVPNGGRSVLAVIDCRRFAVRAKTSLRQREE